MVIFHLNYVEKNPIYVFSILISEYKPTINIYQQNRWAFINCCNVRKTDDQTLLGEIVNTNHETHEEE